MKVYLLIFFSLYSFVGKTTNTSSSLDITNSDTSRPFQKEINAVSSFHYVEMLSKQLNLETISEGYNGLQIRIWESKMASISVTVITQNESNWQAYFYDLIVEAASSTDYSMEKVADQKIKSVSPKSGWSAFSQQLLESDLLTFPDDSKFPPKGLVADGTIYYIEISTSERYRFYTSLSPLQRQKYIPEMKLLSDMLDYIRLELSAYFID